MVGVRRWLCGAAIVLLAAGCGGGGDQLEIVPVQGTVTFKGEPVAGLLVNFEPTEGRPSRGMTDEQGHYEATIGPDRPGVLAGPCRVWVALRPQTVAEEQEMLAGTHELSKKLAPMLTKYARASSPLNLTISASESQVDLNLD